MDAISASLDADDFEPEKVGPLHEYPQTDRITVLMECVLSNNVRGVAVCLSMKATIWNQRGPCGRKPEQVAEDLGHSEIHEMLLARREQAELQEDLRRACSQGARRL